MICRLVTETGAGRLLCTLQPRPDTGMWSVLWSRTTQRLTLSTTTETMPCTWLCSSARWMQCERFLPSPRSTLNASTWRVARLCTSSPTLGETTPLKSAIFSLNACQNTLGTLATAMATPVREFLLLNLVHYFKLWSEKDCFQYVIHSGKTIFHTIYINCENLELINWIVFQHCSLHTRRVMVHSAAH